MSDKYIIKNCPALLPMTKLCDSENMKKPSDYCINCTDCVMKQIVQVCNEYSDKWEDCDFSNGLSEEILKLLDIQEIE